MDVNVYVGVYTLTAVETFRLKVHTRECVMPSHVWYGGL